MIVSATQRSASTIFCVEKAKELGLKFGNQIIDGNWRGYSGPKSAWHEYKGPAVESTSFMDVIDYYDRRDDYVILDHSAHHLILQQSDYFVSRRNLIGAAASMVKIMESRQNPKAFIDVTVNIFLYRAFEFYMFCLEYGKDIIWTDDTRTFNTMEGSSHLRDKIQEYVSFGEFPDIVKTYNLKI
ncbi:hypothetical protein RsoM2USA_246 [Ralstonia phage RsoM2USA]|nr:hypothetical protein RsoM2USA_246 [Ralstonia phage RsoM2USA]